MHQFKKFHPGLISFIFRSLKDLTKFCDQKYGNKSLNHFFFYQKKHICTEILILIHFVSFSSFMILHFQGTFEMCK